MVDINSSCSTLFILIELMWLNFGIPTMGATFDCSFYPRPGAAGRTTKPNKGPESGSCEGKGPKVTTCGPLRTHVTTKPTCWTTNGHTGKFLVILKDVFCLSFIFKMLQNETKKNTLQV